MTVVRKDAYSYSSEVINLGASDNANDSINIQADSDFIIHKLTFFAIDNGQATAAQQTDSTRIIPPVLVQITDQGSGRQIFQDAMPIPNIFGTGSLPFILPSPRRVASNSVLAINYTNLSTTVAYDIYLSFIGIKVYVGR